MPFVALFTATLLLLTGVGLLGTYLPLQLTVQGVSAQIIGLVMSANFFGMLVGAFQCHKLIKSVGHIRAFTALAALATAIVMLHGIYSSLIFWGILRFFSGISTIGLYMVIESWLNECTQPDSRGKVMAIYMVMSYMGMAIGQQLLTFGNTFDLQIFYMVGLMLVLCLVPVAVTRSIHPEAPVFEHLGVFELLRKTPTGMLGCFSSGLLSSAFYAIGPVFCHQIGLTISELSLVMTVTILGGMLLQWPVGIVSDRFDRTYVLATIGLLTACISIAVWFFAGKSYLLFLLLMFVFGGLLFTLYPVAVARAHDVFDQKDTVPVSSALLLSYGAGATIGPVLASTVMSATNSAYGLFIYCLIVAAMYAFITFFLRNRQIITVVAAEDNTAFVVMKNSSPVAASIDPRSLASDSFDDDESEETAH